jgi:quercetin 2,3-dioxygenase
LLGGQPIKEPVVHYGPFVMNTKDEIVQAMEDYQAGKLGTIPAEAIPHRHADDVDLSRDDG